MRKVKSNYMNKSELQSPEGKKLLIALGDLLSDFAPEDHGFVLVFFDKRVEMTKENFVLMASVSTTEVIKKMMEFIQSQQSGKVQN